MSNDTRLTVYELGIIKNFLRDRLISIKITELAVNSLVGNKKETSEQARSFEFDLAAIREKVEGMISIRLDGDNEQKTILPIK